VKLPAGVPWNNRRATIVRMHVVQAAGRPHDLVGHGLLNDHLVLHVDPRLNPGAGDGGRRLWRCSLSIAVISFLIMFIRDGVIRVFSR
jgi:hypothetical protein